VTSEANFHIQRRHGRAFPGHFDSRDKTAATRAGYAVKPAHAEEIQCSTVRAIFHAPPGRQMLGLRRRECFHLSTTRITSCTMPDALELLTTRRSCKPAELAGPAPSAAEIETLLTVASRVPDHGKLVPWRFIVFEGEARRSAGAAIAAAFCVKYPDARPEHIDAERHRLLRAPLVIAVVSRAAPHAKIPEWEQVLSAGAAAMNLVLAAHALGYGANWITEWYAYDRSVLDAFGLEPHERIAGFIHIGRPPHPLEDRPRPALDEIAVRFSA